MYSPDGFASLACLFRDQCFFLSYQEPFVEILKLFSGNFYAFFFLQALVWFALIGSVYFLAKTLRIKHLFLAPFLLIFAGGLFVDNYVGGFENDYVAIVLFVVAMIFWFREKHYLDKWISIALIGLGSTIWFWFAYFRMPLFWEQVIEMNWWAQIFAWGLFTPLFLLCVGIAVWALWKKKDDEHFGKMCLVAFFFPKLWFFSIPLLLKFIDVGLSELDWKPNYLFYMRIIVFALILGQCLRVGINTFDVWNYSQTSNCYTVNHEYLARVQGKSLNYNQASIGMYNACLKNEGFDSGNK